MTQEIQEQIEVVVEVRFRNNVVSDTISASRAKWEEENKELLSDAALIKERQSIEEGKLRELTLQAYAETGNKKPAVGVGIREVIKLEYDSKTAYDWAIQHTIALKLDVSAFEKMAKISSETRPAFVTAIPEPQATIATELSCPTT